MNELSDEKCWQLVEGQEVGRIAVSVAGRPDIFPVNYVARDKYLYFKTAEGTKFASVVINAEVAFEVDGYDPSANAAWSVVVQGRARVLEHEDEVEFAETLGVQPWNLSPKNHFVRIEAFQVSGRRFIAEGRQAKA